MHWLSWQVWLGIGLFLSSGVLYYIHFVLFRDPHHIFIYMLGDLAFLPIEVLLVTLILQELLHMREKRTLLHKLNMVIGAFFSSVGTILLRNFLYFDREAGEIRPYLQIQVNWTEKDFSRAQLALREAKFLIDSRLSHLGPLKSLLVERKEFLLSLLENPNLLEHDAFTNCLWATLHLAEELELRENLDDLSPIDQDHLSADMQRAYSQLCASWLEYLLHLRNQYPYLFSLAVRTNPFNPQAQVEIES